MKNKKGKMALPLILAAATVIRFGDLGRESFWYDELYSAWARKLPLGKLVPEVMAAGHPPLFNAIGHYWNYLGESDFLVRSLSALCGVITVWLVYLAARELFDTRTGLWAAALAAFSPFLIWYSREATSYSWLVMVTTLSFFTLVRCSRRDGWKNWAGYIAATTVAFFTHFFAAVFLVPGFTIYWLLRERKKSSIKAWSISQAVLVFMLGLSLYAKAIVDGSVSYHFPNLKELGYGLIASPFVLIGGKEGNDFAGGWVVSGVSRRGLLALALAALIVISLAVAGVQLFKQLRTRQSLALTLYMAILVAGPALMITSIEGPPFACRYYLWAAPIFVMLLAVPLAALPSKAVLIAGPMIILVFITLTLAGFGIENYDWRGPMQKVAADRQPGDRVLCFPVHHCVVAASHYIPEGIDLTGGALDGQRPDGAYFTTQPGAVWTGYKNWAEYTFMTGSDFENRLKSETDGAGRIWLIAGDGLAMDYPGGQVVEETLEKENWRKAGRWNYPPLAVTLFVSQPGSGAGGSLAISPGLAPL